MPHETKDQKIEPIINQAPLPGLLDLQHEFMLTLELKSQTRGMNGSTYWEVDSIFYVYLQWSL